MKTVSYEFDWWHVLTGLVDLYSMEDGFWQITINTECVTIPLPAPVTGARQEVLPGHITRITGLQVRKVPDLGFMCFEVRDGEVINATNTDQRRPQEGSGSVGEDSRPAPDSYPTSIAA